MDPHYQSRRFLCSLSGHVGLPWGWTLHPMYILQTNVSEKGVLFEALVTQ